MPTGIRLIAGLGNPGPEYTETRHNAGFWFADKLADKFGGSFLPDNRFFCATARLQAGEIDCRLIKPATYMNESGRAVQSFMSYFDLPPEEILIVHDEIDLDPGIARLKRGGGHGGHNGLRDILDRTGSKDYLRLRIGVGHPGHRDDVTPYVLGRPSAEDRNSIDGAINRVLSAMPLIFRKEISKAMNELHQSEKDQVESDK